MTDMKRLVGNQKEIETDYGDESHAYDKNYYKEFADYMQWIDQMGDPSLMLDLDNICLEALAQGFLLDRADAYYAWNEYSAQENASWLGGANLESCRKFLIEVEVSGKDRDMSFPERGAEIAELREAFLKWNAEMKAENVN